MHITRPVLIIYLFIGVMPISPQKKSHICQTGLPVAFPPALYQQLFPFTQLIFINQNNFFPSELFIGKINDVADIY